MEVTYTLSIKRKTRRRMKFGALESKMQRSVVKGRGCGAKDLAGREKNLLEQATEQEVTGKN